MLGSRNTNEMKVPLADDVILRRMGDSGNHPVGTRLPAEPALCSELNLSRTVL